MNVGAIIVEQLDWDGRLKTLVFKPRAEPNFWVALLDEYGEDSAGPFHLLDPRHEREFGERMASQPARLAGGFRKIDADSATFTTSWRGVPTERRARTIYALSLPEDAVPDTIEFIDPRTPGKIFRHSEILDRRRRRVVCYLDCRSRYGQFDFDVRARIRRDRGATETFVDSGSEDWSTDLDQLEETVSLMSDESQTVIQQFFAPTAVGNQTTVVVEGTHLAQRAVESRWAKAWAILAGIATAGAIILLSTGATDIGVAGFVVGVIAIVVGLIPLLHD